MMMIIINMIIIKTIITKIINIITNPLQFVGKLECNLWLGATGCDGPSPKLTSSHLNSQPPQPQIRKQDLTPQKCRFSNKISTSDFQTKP